MLKSLISVLFHPVVLTLVGLGILCAVVFVGGRALADRGVIEVSDWTLGQICVGILAIALLISLWRSHRAAKRALALEQGMRGQALTEVLAPDHKAEIEALRQQFDDALTALKSSRRGKQALHTLPWCVIVGPPASGKTTMLGRSGLNFPHTVQVGHGLRGMGGTRNCDWWFTDQGILLDTAGRYTTDTEDHDEWLAFLDLLRRSHKEAPINGAVVTISVEDLLDGSEGLLLDHAGRVRERLAELGEQLQQDFPVYLVFTKCDLLDGFVETFGSLSKEERKQVWGCTIPASAPLQRADAVFIEEATHLYERLCNHRLSVIPTADSVEAAQAVYSFPFRFAHVADQLRQFVRMLVQPSPYHEGLHIRGFYFTSGTQDEPIDMPSPLEDAGTTGAAAERVSDSHSYFIDDLFTDVVFADRHLARRCDRATKRRTLVRRVAIGGSIAASLVVGGLLLRSYSRNTSRILAVAAAIKDANDLSRVSSPLTDTQKADIDGIREVFEAIDDSRQGMQARLLGRSDNLYPRIRAVYSGVLRKFFLAPCQQRLGEQLVSYAGDRGRPPAAERATPPDASPVEAAYSGAREGEAAVPDAKIRFSRELTLYEMIAHERPVDLRAMRSILDEMHLWSWNTESLGTHSEVERDRIEAHLAAFTGRLLPGETSGAQPLWSVTTLTDAKLEEIRGIRAEDAPIALITKAMKQDQRRPVASFLPGVDLRGISQSDWLVHDAFVDRKALRDAETVFGVMLETMPESAEALRTWRKLGISELEDRYAREWTEVLSELRPTPSETLETAAVNLERHTRAGSVYEAVTLLVRQRLAEVSALEPRGRDLPWLVDALGEIRKLEDDIDMFTALPDDGERVMRDLAEHQGDHVWKVLEALRVRWKTVDQRLSAGAEPELGPAIRRALRNLVASVRDALKEEVRREVQEYWDSTAGRKFRSFASSYPFDPNGADVPPSEFVAMFRPGTGSYDVAYEKLHEFTVPHGVTDALLTFTPEFEDDRRRVLDIQSAMFPDAAAEPSLAFLLATENDADVSDTQLLVGDKRVSTRDMRPARLAQIERTWTLDDIGAAVRMTFVTAPPQTEETTGNESGPTGWSLFRLVESGEPTASSSDDRAVICKWSFSYDVAGAELQTRQAVLKFVSIGERNPLRPGFFRRFKFAKEAFIGVGATATTARTESHDTSTSMLLR